MSVEDQIVAAIDRHRWVLARVHRVVRTGRCEEMRALIRWAYGLEAGPWKPRESETPTCLSKIPDLPQSYSYRHRFCRRKSGHKPPHCSQSREWCDGDLESKPRKDKA